MTHDPYPALMRERLWNRVHKAITLLLFAVLAAVVGLAAVGRLHFGAARPIENPGKKTLPEPAVGRYQIEPVEQTRQWLNRMEHLSYQGELIQEMWVFRYTGGYVECKVETDEPGLPTSAGAVPGAWPDILRKNEGLKSQQADAFVRQGYIVLLALSPALPADRALAPYSAVLGGLFGLGPAGPLHPLVNLHLETRPPRRFRLFMTIDPVKGGTGQVHLSAEREFLVRLPAFAGPLKAQEDYVGGGRNLEAERRIVILDCQRGHGRVQLEVRFLSDGEVRGLGRK